MINFYRRYIPDCAEVIAPLTELTRNRAPNNVEWGAEQERAFKRGQENKDCVKLSMVMMISIRNVINKLVDVCCLLC